jgi:hypothetical protein
MTVMRKGAAVGVGPAHEWKLSSDLCLHGARILGTARRMGPAGRALLLRAEPEKNRGGNHGLKTPMD